MLQTISVQAVETTGNDYPVILVHGLSGWGPDEGLILRYWGSTNEDYIAELNNAGIEAYAVGVGPFSSNWDRACELYAYIKGGRVDYGKAHSEKYGHARYGKTFPGIYTKWGEEGEDGTVNKIHLVGHSMGGQTIRTITQLLKVARQEEIDAVLGTGASSEEVQQAVNEDLLSPLFIGGHDLVHSNTSIATPHDGTVLAHGTRAIIPLARKFLVMISGLAGLSEENNVFDFKLDQWGLKREPNESYKSYSERVWNSNLWYDTKDFSIWDLSIQGAKELNEWVKTHDDVYYFSFATEETYDSWITNHQLPEPGMNPLFIPSAFYIGSFTGQVGDVMIDTAWFPNDGLVSVRSAKGPTLGTDVTIEYVDAVVGTPEQGRWNFLGTLDSTDHIDIIGFLTTHEKSTWYRSLGEYLQKLDK